MSARILYTKPSITDLEVRYSTDAAANGWGEHCYDYIVRFEKLFASHLGVNHTVATSSCTGALHMGLSALGIGFGDEVILADTNWIATAAPIVHLGAKPVFVDIDPASWCIDPIKVKDAITPQTKAIIVTHLYGNLCDMDELLSIGLRHNIPIIEDAAEAIGSIYKGRPAGSMGRFSTFSFHGTKTITTGEGGMFATNDPELFDLVTTLSNHGRSKHQSKQFWPDCVGFKYKMSNIQAAIGCAQLERIGELISRKRQILAYYKENIECIDIQMNPEGNDMINGAWMPTVVFSERSNVTREMLQEAFSSANIDARVFFWPLSSMEYFECRYTNTNSYSIPKRAVNLPSYNDLTSVELDRVISVVKGMLK